MPGFDIIFTGHDHIATNKVVKDPDGRNVAIVGAQAGMTTIGVATVTFTRASAGDPWSRTIATETKAMSAVTTDIKFVNRFAPQFRAVQAYVSRPIGKIAGENQDRDSMFGDSAFVDLIHTIQLELCGTSEFGLNKAEISFAAPLSADAAIPASADGTLFVRDMFNLYRYENFLYTMNIGGASGTYPA